MVPSPNRSVINKKHTGAQMVPGASLEPMAFHQIAKKQKSHNDRTRHDKRPLEKVWERLEALLGDLSVSVDPQG